MNSVSDMRFSVWQMFPVRWLSCRFAAWPATLTALRGARIVVSISNGTWAMVVCSVPSAEIVMRHTGLDDLFILRLHSYAGAASARRCWAGWPGVNGGGGGGGGGERNVLET